MKVFFSECELLFRKDRGKEGEREREREEDGKRRDEGGERERDGEGSVRDTNLSDLKA